MNMWASGRIGTSLSRLPAGTTSRVPSIWRLGSADPQIEQKDLLCRVDGNVNRVTLSCPDSQLKTALAANKLAACADPESFRQYSQWHR
jgi:hypothetical protein